MDQILWRFVIVKMVNKNNKIMIVMLILGVFLISLITAQVIADRRQATIDINQTIRDTLATKNITEPSTKDLGCDENRCYFELYQDLGNGETYNLGHHSIQRNICIDFDIDLLVCNEFGNRSEETMESLQDEIIEQMLIKHAGDLDYRASRNNGERITVLDDSDVDIGNGAH